MGEDLSHIYIKPNNLNFRMSIFSTEGANSFYEFMCELGYFVMIV